MHSSQCYLFIMSLIFALLLLFLVTVDARRSDYRGRVTPHANSGWGDWGTEAWCAKGYYAWGFRLQVEGKQGGGDDTAVNGIMLHCKSLYGIHGHSITSTVGPWGGWGHALNCPHHSFLKGVSMRSERPQHSGDDTAVNNFKFSCQTQHGSYRLMGHGMPWGTWSNRVDCPRGSLICGLKTKVERPQGRGDDTALNDVIFFCCSPH